jgi:hypothetical protein
LFTNEDLLKEELAKRQVKLSLAEQAEKEKTSENDREVKSQNAPQETNASEEDSGKKPEEKPLVNGVDPKIKLLNGDSAENDSTAVNTPGSSTPPLTKIVSTTSDPTTTTTETKESEDSDAAIPTLDSLRLQVLHLQKLMDFLQEEFGPTRKKLNDLLKSHDMKFGLLWCLFRLGSVITFKDYESGFTMAGEVRTPRISATYGEKRVDK